MYWGSVPLSLSHVAEDPARRDEDDATDSGTAAKSWTVFVTAHARTSGAVTIWTPVMRRRRSPGSNGFRMQHGF
jgi:hypothetical protein